MTLIGIAVPTALAVASRVREGFLRGLTATLASRCSVEGWELAASDCLRLIVFISATGIVNAHAQTGVQVGPTRLDAPPTEANSLQVDLGGKLIRLPKALVGHAKLAKDQERTANFLGIKIPVPTLLQRFVSPDPRQPIHAEALHSLTFWYPDMTPTCYGMGCRVDEPESSSRFKVYIGTVTNSPEDAPEHRLPRPMEMLQNLAGDEVPEIAPSPYAGLRRVSFWPAWVKKHPELLGKPPPASSGSLFIQTDDRPYELLLSCDSQCRGDLFSRRHYFHLFVVLDQRDPATLAQFDDVAMAINRMVEAWISSSK